MRKVNSFVSQVLNNYSNIVSIFLIGSRVNKTKVDEGSDIDIVVVVDDLEYSWREEIEKEIKESAKKIEPKLHCQVMPITKFWKYIEIGSPITYTMIRDSKILFDIGFISIIKKLQREGYIRPKREAVERQLAIAKQLIKITYHNVNQGLIKNLEGAIVSSAQSALIEMGIEPPTPKEVPDYIKRVLVDRNLLDEKYYHICKRIIDKYKEIEHKKGKGVSPTELQELYNETNDFVSKMEEIVKAIKKQSF